MLVSSFKKMKNLKNLSKYMLKDHAYIYF